MTGEPDLVRAALGDLVDQALDAAAGIIDHGPWCAPSAGSDAAKDLSRSPWGELPVRRSLDIAWMAMGAAVSEARAFGAVLPGARTCYAPEVLARAVLEAASLALWLLEPRIGPRARVARSIAFRLNGAAQMESALDNVTLGEGEQRSDYGELREDVVRDAGYLGMPTNLKPVKCDDQIYPSYSGRVLGLTSLSFSSMPRTPYQIYSGVAHAELWGLWRGVAELQAEDHPHPRYRLISHPLAVHTAASATIGALVISAARAADYLGAAGISERIRQWTEEADRAMEVLRPAG